MDFDSAKIVTLEVIFFERWTSPTRNSTYSCFVRLSDDFQTYFTRPNGGMGIHCKFAYRWRENLQTFHFCIQSARRYKILKLIGPYHSLLVSVWRKEPWFHKFEGKGNVRNEVWHVVISDYLFTEAYMHSFTDVILHVLLLSALTVPYTVNSSRNSLNFSILYLAFMASALMCSLFKLQVKLLISTNQGSINSREILKVTSLKPSAARY